MNINRLDEQVDVSEVASALGITKQTVHGWKFSGRYKDRLPFYKAGSGKVYCLRRDFEKFKLFWLFGDDAAQAAQN